MKDNACQFHLIKRIAKLQKSNKKDLRLLQKNQKSRLYQKINFQRIRLKRKSK
jgi:hypothetical protein